MKKQLLLLLSIALFTQSFVFAQQDYALEFDGINSRVQYPNDASLDIMNGATDYTIEVWVYPTSTDIHNNVILKRYYQFALTMYQDANRRVYFTHYTNAGVSTYVNSLYNVININEWNHIAVICNSSDDSLKIYVNGVDVTADSSGTATTQTALTLEPLPDDAHDTYHPNFYVGYSGTSAIPLAVIDKVRIKKTAETIGSLQTAITDAAYTTDANTSILMNFNEGTGDVTVNEVSGTNADLECYGGCAEIPEWVTVASTLSFSDNNTTDFSIFPNPVNGEFFTIQARNNETILEVELVDILGKSVKRIEFNTAVNSENININKLNAGIYIVKIKTDAGIGTQKIVIE